MKHGKLTTNWAYEIGFSLIGSSDNLFWFDVNARYKGDHRGFLFSIGAFRLNFEFNVYDIRHEYPEEWEDYANEYYAEEEYF